MSGRGRRPDALAPAPAPAVAMGLALVAALAAAGCGRSRRGPASGPPPLPYDPPPNPLVGTDGKHVVLVLDDGFDLSVPVFQGKVAGTYTVTCDPRGSPADNIDAALPVDQQKAAYLKAYQAQDTSCQVGPGLTFQVAADFPPVRVEKARWDQEVYGKHLSYDADTAARIAGVLSGETANVNYHGTATAGLIAYHNDIRLVLVEYPLSTASDPVVASAADCPKQAQLDAFVALHRDPDVAKAYVEAPLDAMSAGLVAVEKQYGVGLVNLSLGGSPLAVLTKQLAAAGCGTLDYGPYFAVSGALARQQQQHRAAAGAFAGAEVLSVQAAGNDGAQIDDLTQSGDCAAEDQRLILAGALDAAGKRADFSNFGKCVDFYMLGKNVVVAAPEGFVNVEDGTSFATPLTVRYATLHSAVGEPAAQLIKDLRSHADAAGNLLTDAFPPELSFDLPVPVASYDLLGAGSARQGRPRPGLGPRGVDPRLLRRLLHAGGGSARGAPAASGQPKRQS